MDFMIGCNYWDSKHGTNMWRDFDPDVIRTDLKALSKCGVKYMRVFPIWRDFQPIVKLYAWRGEEKEYCNYNEEPIDEIDSLDKKQLENFRIFCGICDEYNIKLVVSIVTGWMSGRLFLPRCLDGKNPISDPEVLMWTNRFITGFVNAVKDIDTIVMWDLGNECNCLGESKSRYESYVWTAFVRNSIFAADQSRKISSGMHGLDIKKGPWPIADQGELTDYLTPHPYVSKTIKNDIEPMNQLRTTLLPTAQCVLYSDLSGKDTILQEQGTFSQALGNANLNEDFARVNLISAFSHDVKGWFWWCGANHSELWNTPYIWCTMERDLGLLDTKGNPRPVTNALIEISEKIKDYSDEKLNKRERDAICVLSEVQDYWAIASASFVLATQSNINVRFALSDKPLEKSKLYIIPSINGWNLMNRYCFDSIFENVSNGSNALITFDGGQFFHFEEYTGLTSNGIVKTNKKHCAQFDFGKFDYSCEDEILVESIGAEVLARNEEGNIVFSKFAYGKGYVYFLNMPLEINMDKTYGSYADTDAYKIYEIVAKGIIEEKPIISNNPNVGITLHKKDKNSYVVVAVNYSENDIENPFVLQNGYKFESSFTENKIKSCDGLIFTVEK